MEMAEAGMNNSTTGEATQETRTGRKLDEEEDRKRIFKVSLGEK